MYKVKCKYLKTNSVTEIKDPKTGEGTGLFVKEGRLVLSADNPDIKFQVIGNPTYVIKEERDKDRPHVVKRFFTLTMEYRYEDYTSSSSLKFPYRCNGTMLLQRDITTLVPDEDQAILW